jgi:hypothetical protein
MMSPEELIALLERRQHWLAEQRLVSVSSGDIAGLDAIDQQIAGCEASITVLRTGLAT